MHKFTKGHVRNLNGFLRAHRINAGDGHASPNNGLRAPEVAAGDWEAKFLDLFDRAHGFLLRDIGQLSDDEMRSLMNDLNLAKLVIFDELKTKLNS